MYGHPTGIRALALSSDDTICCSISKGALKVWNVANRSCIRSFPLLAHDVKERGSSKQKAAPTSVYGLCCAFLPGNSHVIVGSREGRMQIIDYASGEVVFEDAEAHKGAIWAMDLRPDGEALVTGSADHSVKFWDLELDEDTGKPCFAHTRTLNMNDDVVAVSYSYSMDPAKRLVTVSSLDCTIKVFFDDSLKFFLSLYGHKLPALALDCTDDDTILASAGADKSIKIWGLDFGDTHRTMYGHGDSVTDLKFVRRTHTFFTCSKDKTIRYWDADSFDQILLLTGHTAEVNSLALSKTGGFLMTGGMDRQIRVWERTKDMVFVDEEKDRELEQIFDKVDGAQGSQRAINLTGNADDDEVDGENNADQFPQSESAVRKSVLSVAAGDRLVEALELADQERKDQLQKKKNSKKETEATGANPLLLGMDPPEYVLWLLRTIKPADLEQALLILPMSHMARLVHYMILLLRKGLGVELCSKVAVFLVRIHQNQVSRTILTSFPL
jgi:U3 small nucleolar RNA-associated protein 12